MSEKARSRTRTSKEKSLIKGMSLSGGQSGYPCAVDVKDDGQRCDVAAADQDFFILGRNWLGDVVAGCGRSQGR